MRKYFKEEETKKIKLSKYLKFKENDFKYNVCDEEYRASRTKYVIGIIGDVELDEDTYRLYMTQFQWLGGRYEVRTERETIKGIYELSQKYPFLSVDALDEIWGIYIQDQFEEYSLAEVLGKYFQRYGMTDEAFCKYIDYVDSTAKEFDKKFVTEASKLEMYRECYDSDLIKYLQRIIKFQHITADKIISSLPSSELIEKDKQQLRQIIEETRIYFGACDPISYQMIESLATDKSLEYYPEQPQYVICGTHRIDTTFTKQEFLESIKKEKSKVKIK